MSDDVSEQQGPMDRPPTEEEFAAMMAERLAQTPVRDVLFQSMATFLNMAGIRMGLGPRGVEVQDLAQARQAIESARALMAVAERELGAAQVRPFREPLAELQMAFARLAESGASREGEDGDDGPSSERTSRPAATQPPRAQAPPKPADDAASRLWVPPGSRR